ncbi:MAG: Resolvase domain protein [Herbinix sp.]|jgi:DNA invertase Pin-like site-specific DNA recombinase|nr:Resolvase domain protein [Herbinix sp.]
MRAVAYIRVSTNKEEQALSLKNQREFFEKYITDRGDELVKIYCDEGKSATKTKNRKALQEMLSDGKKGFYQKIYAKEISRLFRNQLDYIEFTRDLLDERKIVLHLAAQGEKGKDVDSLSLSIMSLLAENESVKISERVKFGKDISKKRGIVPNFVFGYERIDKYTLKPDIDGEAYWVHKIFDLYTEEHYGMSRIADYLYKNRVVTKKKKSGEPNYNWTQHTVSCILKNRLYTGVVINNKENIKSIYTGARLTVDSEDWYVTERPEFRIISDEQFEKAQKLIKENAECFPSNENGLRKMTRRSEDHVLSNMLKCSTCGGGYRRYKRKYSEDGPYYYWWTCGKRQTYGSARCTSPHIRIEEEDALTGLTLLFDALIKDREAFFRMIESKCSEVIKEYLTNATGLNLDELNKELKDLQAQRERIKLMMKKGILEIDEGAADLANLDEDIKRISTILHTKDVTAELTRKVKESVKNFIRNFDTLSFKDGLTNNMLRGVVKEIVVINEQELHVYFKVDDEINGLFFPILIESDCDTEVEPIVKGRALKSKKITDTDREICT